MGELGVYYDNLEKSRAAAFKLSILSDQECTLGYNFVRKLFPQPKAAAVDKAKAEINAAIAAPPPGSTDPELATCPSVFSDWHSGANTCLNDSERICIGYLSKDVRSDFILSQEIIRETPPADPAGDAGKPTDSIAYALAFIETYSKYLVALNTYTEVDDAVAFSDELKSLVEEAIAYGEEFGLDIAAPTTPDSLSNMNKLVEVFRQAIEDAKAAKSIRKKVAESGQSFKGDLDVFIGVISSQDRVYRLSYDMSAIEAYGVLYEKLGPNLSFQERSAVIDSFFDLAVKFEKHRHGPTNILKILRKLGSIHQSLINILNGDFSEADKKRLAQIQRDQLKGLFVGLIQFTRAF